MIEGINLSDVSGWAVSGALCIFIVVALVKGWIVTGNTTRMWFEAWQTDRHTVEKLADQVEHITKGQETLVALITSIKAVGDRVERDRSP